MTEGHSLKLTIQIKKIKLQVRFPCSLSFQLKIDNAQYQCQNICELVKGECSINQIMEIDTEALFDNANSQYCKKDMTILVLMHSNNGIVPAGSIYFNPISKNINQITEYVCALQKCPDRSAEIFFNASYRLTQRRKINTVYKSLIADRKQKLQNSFSNVMLKKSQIRSKIVEHQILNESKNQKDFSPSSKMSWDFRQSYKSDAYLQTVLNQFDQRDQTQFVPGKAQERRKRLLVKEKMPQNQRQLFMKEIAKLKGDIIILQNNDKKNDLIRLKQENETIATQLDRAKQKLKTLERRERELNVQLKEAKQLTDKNRSRVIQIETTKNENEALLVEKEKILKQVQAQLKKHIQTNQHLRISMNNLQKRSQSKQNSFQEQVKRLGQKYAVSQSERQRISFEQSNLLTKLEQSEKKYNLNIKERERSVGDDKNKLNKQIEQLASELDSLKRQEKERLKQLGFLKEQLKLEQKRANQQEEKLSACQIKLDLTTTQLKKQLEKHTAFKAQIESAKIIEQQKGTLRKKINQLISELAKYKDKVERMGSDMGNNEAKLKQFERQLAQRIKEKDSLQNQVITIKLQLDNAKRQNERIIGQSQSLSNNNLSVNKKINLLKEKIAAEQQEKRQLQSQYDSHIMYLTKSKQENQNQIQQTKWALQKQSQQFATLSNRLKEANQQILQLNQVIFIYEDKIIKNNQDKESNQRTIDEMKIITNSAKEKQQTLSGNIKKLNQKVYYLQNNNQSSEDSIFQLKNKLEQAEANLLQQVMSHQKYVKQKQKYASLKSNQLNQLQLQNSSLIEELSVKKRELMLKENELGSLRQQLRVSESNAAHHLMISAESKDQLNIVEREMGVVLIELEKAKKSLEEENKNYLLLKNQWESHQNNIAAAMQQFIEEMLKEDGNNLHHQPLISFPNETLSNMYIQAIKKKNTALFQHQKIMTQLNEQKWAVEYQLQTVKVIAAAKQEELQTILKLHRDKTKKILAQQQQQRRKAEVAIQLFDQKILQLSSQNQRALNQIEKMREYSEQLKREGNKVFEEKQALALQLARQRQIVLQLKLQQTQLKTVTQSRLLDSNQQNQILICRLRNEVQLISAKLQNEVKLNGQKDQMIKKLHLQIVDLTQTNQLLQSAKFDLQNTVSKIEESKKDNENKWKAINEQMTKFQLQLQKKRQTQINSRIQFQEIEEKLQIAHRGLTEALVDREKINSQLLAAQTLNRQLEQNHKRQMERLKLMEQKYCQQNTHFRQNIIQLHSSMDLSLFQVSQKDSQILSLQSSLSQVKEQMIKKCKENLTLNEKINTISNKTLYIEQNIQTLQQQKQFLQSENQRLREKASVLEEELDLAQQQIETIELKQKELLFLKEELQLSQLKIESLANQIARSPKSQQNIKLNTLAREENLKIQQLQQMIQFYNIDLQIERQKLMNEFNHQKTMLLKDNQNMKREMLNLKEQFDFQREQLNKEIQSMNDQIQKLNQQIECKHEVQSIYLKLNHFMEENASSNTEKLSDSIRQS